MGAASRWPIWQTRPVGLSLIVLAALGFGALGVVFGAFILGYAFDAIAGMGVMDGTAPQGIVSDLGVLLSQSVEVYWIGLCVAVFLGLLSILGGFAGWAVAGFIGLYVTAFSHLMTTWDPMTLLNLPVLVHGALLGLIYWLSIRVILPDALGIASSARNAPI